MYSHKAPTPFEKNLIDLIRSQGSGAVIHEDRNIPQYKGGRALVIDKAYGLIYNCDIYDAKYSATVYNVSGAALVKNFKAGRRSAPGSVYGSGIILDGPNTGKTPSKGDIYISNMWSDLEMEMLGNYKVDNSEPICGERGNKRAYVRESFLTRGGEAGIDSKTSIDADACFVIGARCLRNWGFSDKEDANTPDRGIWTIANSICLMTPSGLMYWAAAGPTHLNYYNCLFGIVGMTRDELRPDLPEEWTNVRNGKNTEDGQPATIKRLSADPFDRSANSFWQPCQVPVEEGWLKGLTAKPWPIVVNTPPPPPPPPLPPEPPKVDPVTAHLALIGQAYLNTRVAEDKLEKLIQD